MRFAERVEVRSGASATVGVVAPLVHVEAVLARSQTFQLASDMRHITFRLLQNNQLHIRLENLNDVLGAYQPALWMNNGKILISLWNTETLEKCYFPVLVIYCSPRSGLIYVLISRKRLSLLIKTCE